MRSRARVLAALGALGLAAAWLEPVAAQGFNPQGRKKPPSSAGRKPSGEARTPKSEAPPRPDAPRSTGRAESPRGNGRAEAESSDALIARYMGIVLSQPGEEFPLERLVQLYRTRDGHLDTLIADLERHASGSGASAVAARVAVAGAYAHAGQPERAVAEYRAIIDQNPKHVVALTRLSHLLARQGDRAAARRELERALSLPQPEPQREQGLRSLVTWALDDGDVPAAKAAHERLVKLGKGSFFVRAELGRELAARGRHAEAEVEYRELVRLARGDNRTLAPALKDLGLTLVQQGKYDEAERVLAEAEAAAGAQSGLLQEILEATVLVYRATDRLPALITRLEARGGRSHERMLLLASLYEETGRVADARKAYEAVLAGDPRSIPARLKVIQLLSLAGELDAVVRHYEQLIRFSPNNPEYVFRLAEAHLQNGDRKAALKSVDQLSARAGLDEAMLAALVDFYERLGEGGRALALLEQLAKGGGERHLIELGDRYYAQGDQERAIETWQRILRGQGEGSARALTTLGEVYLEHDMPERALEALTRAVELSPDDVKLQKALALALERSGAGATSRELRSQQYGDAQRIWERLLERATREHDTGLAREARQHIVTLWGLTGTLEQRAEGLARRLSHDPPDLDAGRLLAEAYLRLGRYRDAERALRRVLEGAPADVDAHLRLERALVQSGRIAEAIAVLEALTRLEPLRAREYYQRMGRYAAELYQDEAAIEYTRRAVELSPEDAEGHYRLGEMYRRRQDTERAIAEYRRAIAKNDRLFVVHFQLAELLLNRQEVDEADQLLRRVLRASPDEQLIANAARLSMQIHLGRGTLETLEKDLLPLALSSPTRPIYRRLLVELYGSLAFPLVNEAQSSDEAVARRARAALERLGQRAVGPLLNALGDPQDTQQRVAIELLSHIHNDNAGPALLAFAASEAEVDLRVRAMIAAGALEAPSLYERFARFLREGGASETDPVGVAATWAVARLSLPRARPLLTRLIDDHSPTLGAVAVLGLSSYGDPKDVRLFIDIARSPEHAPLTRAAAAFALGVARPAPRLSPEVAAEIGKLTQASDVVVRATATTSLARLRAPNAPSAIADALLSRDPELTAKGVAAAALYAGAQVAPPRSLLPMPERRVDVRQMLSALAPSELSPADEARALVALTKEIAAAAARAAQGSPDQARAVTALLLTQNGEPTFAPLASRLGEVEPALRAQAERAIERIGAAVVEPLLALAEHPAPEVRGSVVEWLGTRPEPSAERAVVAALGDAERDVQRRALTALGRRRSASATGAIVRVLGGGATWPLRLEAAKALTRPPEGRVEPDVARALAAAAEQDEVALVREAAARALAQSAPDRARPVLERLRTKDPEVWVRQSAAALSQSLP